MKKEKIMILASILLLGSCTTSGESSSEKASSEEPNLHEKANSRHHSQKNLQIRTTMAGNPYSRYLKKSICMG